MPSEPRKSSEEIHEATLGSLRGCLVEGDPAQRNRERKVRRRALVISILTQCAFLAALVLVPLFGKTEHLTAKEFVPIPPYGHPPTRVHGDPSHRNTNPVPIGEHFFTLNPDAGRPHPHATTTGDANNFGDSDLDSLENSSNTGPACSWCVPIGNKDSGPRPPQPAVQNQPRSRVHVTTIDPAMLQRRVEPIYPPLARQIHKEGRVELRAVIATDGTIQSLEIVGGDPIFYPSAKEAVSQWRYRPTILNGQPVEVDTYITVIYTMQH